MEKSSSKQICAKRSTVKSFTFSKDSAAEATVSALSYRLGSITLPFKPHLMKENRKIIGEPIGCPKLS
jgi:hypothetical protein